MEFQKNSVVKLVDGREVKIINLPSSFMANGSYEVTYGSKKFWVKPEEIMYQIDLKWVDDLSNYLEIIFDESGINIIPKELESIDIESDREDIKRVKLNLFDGRKHKTINLHVGDTIINDKEKITVRPKKEKTTKIKKIINFLNDKEDEI